MPGQYKDLQALLAQDPQAQQYFDALPSYVKDHIATRARGVNSMDSLQDYAQNLLRGDG